jgi:type I restriction enzyme S subunit
MSFPRYERYKDSGVEWLGEVPEHWDVKRVKNIFHERNQRSEDGSQTLLSVSAYTGVSPRSEIVSDGDNLSRAESLEGYKICYRNDLVINIMLAWNRGLGFTKYDGIVSPAYCVFYVIDKSLPSFLDYLVRADEFLVYYKSFSAGVIESRLRLYPDVFGRLSMMLPPISEQQLIANFLDQETAKIDNLIAEQERLIALLKEKRQAVISHAVTKGLNTNVPMKDSGVEWLGEVPEHWEVKRLKHIKSNQANAFVDGPFGSNLKSEHFIENGDVYVIESNFATQGKLNLEELKTISSSHFSNIQRSQVKETDLVIAKIGAQFGKVSILPYIDKPAVVSGNSMKLTVSEDICAIKWAYLQLQNLKQIGEMELLVNGSAQPALSLSGMNQLIFLLPPKSEQAIIIGTVETETQKFETLIAESINVISLLKERRSALISSAVTGKIDVRNFVPSQSKVEAMV